MGLEIKQNFLTKNNCYKTATIQRINGIMVHSTACPGVQAINFLKSWNSPTPNGKSVCVHAFIDSTGIYQTLPFNFKGWHSGVGKKGSANAGYIGFEICEPKDYNDFEYFSLVKQKAVDLCVYLCEKYNLAPDSIITHCEGYRLGIASNHSDIDHWWLKFQGYSMDKFRKEVANKLFAEKDEKDEVESMNKVELKAFIEETVKNMGVGTPPSTWAEDFIEQAQAAGITDGKNPCRLATREEVMIMALRASEQVKNK